MPTVVVAWRIRRGRGDVRSVFSGGPTLAGAYSAEFSSAVPVADPADLKTLFSGAANFSSLCFSGAAHRALPPEAVFRWP
jgi:hypothetical protein